MTKEELQNIADTYGLYTEEDVKNRLSCELLAIGAKNEELEAENAELTKNNMAVRAKLRNKRNDYEVLDTYYQLTKEELNCVVTDFNTFKSKAKEIIKNFLNAKSIEDTCVAESEAEDFLKEE